MANLIDITSSILAENTICFDLRNINTEHISTPIQDPKFGILNFKAVTCNETSSELDFLFVIDCSGSMSDMCSDHRSKMQHIIHTLKNMIIFFHEHPAIKVNITVNAFDTKIYKIVPRTNITTENLSEIIHEIEKIRPRGSTNIEFALAQSIQEINRLQTLFPSNIINHIFMTDGEATDGSKDIQVLKQLVEPNVTNAFIGFGIEHDSTLLNGICSLDKSAYYFIDKLESSGLVYGEILHGIIYKLLTDSEIIIENGVVYNFKTNTWDESLKIGDIISESNKTFNIASANPEECRVNIKGNMDDLVVLFPSNLIESADLSSHIYRQRTLQLLYEVNDFNKRKREMDLLQSNKLFDLYDRFDNPNPFAEEKKQLKTKMTNLMKEIKKYMTDNNIEEDKLLKNLCDDIYICYRTFDTKYGSMFSNARQTSQGTQRQYTASHTIQVTENIYENRNIRRLNRAFGGVPNIPVLQRQTNAVNYAFDDELPDLLNHTVSDFADTPYLSPQATQVMREISRPIEDELSIQTQEY